jgi:hypothetical protein
MIESVSGVATMQAIANEIAMAHHILMEGKLHLYKRENSRHWQCSTYLAGKNRRVTTKEESLAQAKDFAEDWFLELKGKHRRGEVKAERPSAKPPTSLSANTRSSPRASITRNM